MVSPTVTCEHCQKSFQLRIDMKEGSTLISKGNISRCPHCGKVTRLDDGVFVATKTVFERIASVVPAPDELEALIRVLSSAKAQESPQAAKVVLDEEGLSLDPYLEGYLGFDPGRWKDLLSAVLFALGWVLVCIKMPNAATAMKAFESIYNAAKTAFGKHDDGLSPGNAAQRGKEAAAATEAETRRKRNEKKRRRKQRRG